MPEKLVLRLPMRLPCPAECNGVLPRLPLERLGMGGPVLLQQR